MDNKMGRYIMVGLIALGLLMFGCSGQQPQPIKNDTVPGNDTVPQKNDTMDNKLHMICQGSACCMGFGNTCATFKCEDDVYYTPGGRDTSSIYVNGTSGEVIARCGGNMMPFNSDLCPTLEKTCDMTKPASMVPDVVKNPKMPNTEENEGKRMMRQKIMEKCNMADVDKVYLCDNDMIHTVSTNGMSTYFKADGSVSPCPAVSPETMSPVCKSLMDACSGQSEVSCDEAK